MPVMLRLPPRQHVRLRMAHDVADWHDDDERREASLSAERLEALVERLDRFPILGREPPFEHDTIRAPIVALVLGASQLRGRLPRGVQQRRPREQPRPGDLNRAPVVCWAIPHEIPVRCHDTGGPVARRS